MPLYHWKSVKDSLPDALQTVWLANKTGWVGLGCLVESDGGWHWAQSNGIIYKEGNKIVSECESEDLDVDFWHELPDVGFLDAPPNGERVLSSKRQEITVNAGIKIKAPEHPITALVSALVDSGSLTITPEALSIIEQHKRIFAHHITEAFSTGTTSGIDDHIQSQQGDNTDPLSPEQYFFNRYVRIQ